MKNLFEQRTPASLHKAPDSHSLGFLLAALVFALILKVMPHEHMPWKDVWIGALFTAILFALGKSLIGLHIGRSAFASGFGATGSLALILPWAYWSAQILLAGADFTCVCVNSFGSRRPAAVATPTKVTAQTSR